MLRKCLSTGNSHHPHAAVERLYLPQFLGRRGIVNIEHLYQRRIVMLSRHLQTSQDSTSEGLLPAYLLVSTTQVIDL